MLNVAWLALGTVYLLAGVAIGNKIRWWLVGLTGFATGIVAVAPTKQSIIATELPIGREVFCVAPRVLAAIGSGVPAVVIIVGALWSAWRVVRKKTHALSFTASRSVV